MRVALLLIVVVFGLVGHLISGEAPQAKSHTEYTGSQIGAATVHAQLSISSSHMLKAYSGGIHCCNDEKCGLYKWQTQGLQQCTVSGHVCLRDAYDFRAAIY